nr:hypothetical protein [uncultured Treponema sp.]
MAAEEVDVIKHLIEVEREASEIVLEAQKKADTLVNSAKSQADEEFRKSYSKLVEEFDSQEIIARKKINSQHNSEIQNYRESLNDLRKDVSGFNSALDSILFA